MGKTPLQFSIYQSQAIMYIFRVHGPTCQAMYFRIFLYCLWTHLYAYLDKGVGNLPISLLPRRSPPHA